MSRLSWSRWLRSAWQSSRRPPHLRLPAMPSRCMASPACRPTSRISPTSIPMRRRAAPSTTLRPAHSTASTRSSFRAARARGVLDLVFGNNVFDSLMQRSADEPFTLYPLLAKSVETDDERSFVEFTLDRTRQVFRRPAGDAGGRDVHPGAARPQGPAALRRDGEEGRQDGEGRRPRRPVHLQERPDRELPLILGLLPILPKHAIDPDSFDKLDAEADDRQRPLPAGARSSRARA